MSHKEKPQPFRLNITRRCNCCKVSTIRQYIVVNRQPPIAICPDCDYVQASKKNK